MKGAERKGMTGRCAHISMPRGVSKEGTTTSACSCLLWTCPEIFSWAIYCPAISVLGNVVHHLLAYDSSSFTGGLVQSHSLTRPQSP
jgi:hypothetical protein